MGGDMRTVEEEYVDRLPWRRVTQADYDAACSHCEILITVNDTETLSAIRAALRFDKRNKGSHGRALRRDVYCVHTQLLAGDRLKPSRHLDDIFRFGIDRVFPLVATFWRVARESIATHRNPLFGIPGFTVDRLLPDLLHVVYLGVAQNWVVASMWALFRADVWRTGSQPINILRLRAELAQYYRRRRNDTITPVQMITEEMMGTSANPARQPFKGAETTGLIDYCIGALQRYMPAGGGRELLLAGLHLRRFVFLVDSSPLNPPEEVKTQMRRSTVKFLRLATLGGMRHVAKCHQLLHVVHQCLQEHGNPKYYDVFLMNH